MGDHTEMILRATRYIEEHLGEQLRLDDIAAAAYCSPYHFHRVFKRIVGVPPGEYVRSRRLTEAADALRTTDKRIIDVAMDWGFESQSAFTAAFRRHQDTSPAAFRRGEHISRSRQRLTGHMLRSYRRVMMSEPKMVKLDGMSVVGVPYYGNGSDTGIDEIYVNLKQQILEVEGRTDPEHFYGICFHDPELAARTGKFNYMVAVQVDSLASIPLPMVGKTLPAHEYAVFRSKEASYMDIDPVVSQMWAYAREWIAENKVEQSRYFDFERYTEDGAGQLKYLEIWIPLGTRGC